MPKIIPAGPVLLTLTSATGVTSVMTGGVRLFKMFVSPVGELTLATFVKLPLAGAVTVTDKLVTCPLINVPKSQLTTPLELVPLPDAPTKLTPPGKVSVTITLLAEDGPKLVTEIE